MQIPKLGSRSLLLVRLLGFCLMWSPVVSADASGWAYFGGGASQFSARDEPRQQGVIQIDAGIGTAPDSTVVVGGLLRGMSHLSAGTDLCLLQRTATSGFASGDWGAALDLGAYQRWWGTESTGFTGALNLGGLWGTQLSAAVLLGPDVQTYTLTLGFDWSRLTANRASSQQAWPNYLLPRRAPEARVPGLSF